MKIRKTLSVMRKEIWHIVRDRRTFFLVTISPVFLLITFTYTLSAKIEHVPLAVMDYDRTPLSRQYLSELTSGKDLDLRFYASDYGEIERLLLQGEVRAAVIIPPDFMEETRALKGGQLQIIVDGTEPNTGNFALAHIASFTDYFATRILQQPLESLAPIDLRIRTWYNPSLKSTVGMVPALIALVLTLPAVSVSLAIAREKEQGTFEQLIATPLSRSELLVGKLTPYIASGLLDVVLCTLVGIFWFGVPFRGNFLLYLLLAADFFFASLSMGLLISTFVSSQQVAMIASLLIFLFPGFFMSGLFFPISSMPPLMKMEAYALPTTHFVIISRGLFVKGLGLGALWPYTLVLFFMGLLVLGLTILFFRKRL
ncbi:MAG: ABC transporter permease [Anaerolineae bacterium]